MKFVFTKALVLVAVACEFAVAVIPKLQCPKQQPDLNKCLSDYVKLIIAECEKRNPFLIAMNPTYINQFTVAPNDIITFSLTNLNMFSKSITVTALNIDLITGAYDKTLNCEIITIDCDFCARGVLNDKPIEACGHAVITATGARLNYRNRIYKKDLGRIQIYQVDDGTSDLSIKNALFGLMDISCKKCQLSDEDTNKLRHLFSECENDFVNKLSLSLAGLIDEVSNMALRVQDADEVFVDGLVKTTR